jgi:hypothetical protein
LLNNTNESLTRGLPVGANTGSRVANTVIRPGAALFIASRVKTDHAISQKAIYGMRAARLFGRLDGRKVGDPPALVPEFDSMTIDVCLSRRNGLLVGFSSELMSKPDTPIRVEDVGSICRLRC